MGTRIASLLLALALLGCGPEFLPGVGDTGARRTDAGTGGDIGDPTRDEDGDGYSRAQGDCNDSDPRIHPAAKEICADGIDNNCNGAKDLFEPDADGDGYGPCNGDCDDGDPKIHPSAKEIPGDGKDNNCDGVTDADLDGDGFTTAQGDCDDQNAQVHPNAREHCFDGIDNNCNTHIDAKEPDKDKDGFGPCQGDCDDGDPKTYPGAKEIPGDGKDNNCDNMVDVDIDGDGWTVANGDCDDTDPKAHPGAPIACNSSKDFNCNKIPDKNEDQDKDGDGATVCKGDCDDNDASRSPHYTEIPGDGIDNDCDGKKDNVLKCDCGAGVNAARAIDLCDKGVTITAGGSAQSRGVRQSAYGAIKTRQGCGFYSISSGKAWSTSVQSGSNMSTSGNPVGTTKCMKCTTPGSSTWVHPTPKGCCEDKTEYDPAWVKLTIKVPKNAKGFKFDFIFLSAEYPEWVHSSFNDTFYAVEKSKALKNVQNICFDAKGQPLTVNNGWFENPASATQSLAGTGYDNGIGSSSGWLTTTAPATPGETMELTFWVHDEGDHILDSAVIIDNWRWVAAKVGGPVTIK